MPELDRVTHLAFLELDAGDRANLLELRPILEKHADAFVAAFYRHLLSFEATRALLSDPDVKERL
ncbi:MAG: protoglobin domain-containing protein, partial [Steroidobacteraceae bacterium]